jgi:exodeoxyribonuclease-3
MRLVTWNVNSVRARQERVVEWTRANQPDVMCLQEIKVEDQDFPEAAFRDLGYHVAVWGQRTYNGVALLARAPLEDVRRGLDGGQPDEPARLLAATVAGLRVYSVYAPNGEAPGTEKFAFKLGWMGRLAEQLAEVVRPDAAIAVCGDFNVAPGDLDVYDPEGLREQIHVSTPERAALAKLTGVGLVDTFRKLHPTTPAYTFWDYRMLAFPKNRGYRIDHILLTPSLLARVTAARIDREARKGKQPSDHAPLIVELDYP